MKAVAAYLLAVLGGNANPDEKAIEKILDSVGVHSNKEETSLLLSQLYGKDVYQIIAAGNALLATIPASSGKDIEVHFEKKENPKKEESKGNEKKKEEPKEEEEEDMGFGLFD